ncbi:MAG: hypothetical protein AzoDbin1_05243 [Azoarcus sp.]|nr:hypothetical protein [Azoarcus sp.]
MRISTDTKINSWAKVFVKLGWELDRATRHVRLISPDGRTKLTIPGSPSDSRAAQNWRSQVRRITGIDPALA